MIEAAMKKIFLKKKVDLKGADDVYLTEKNIAVRRTVEDKRGRVVSDVTTYYPKTRENLKLAREKQKKPLRKGRD